MEGGVTDFCLFSYFSTLYREIEMNGGGGVKEKGAQERKVSGGFKY
jgi:hypothetical protein